jgi:hypothetical protein
MTDTYAVHERLYNAARDSDELELIDALSQGADINWMKKSNVSQHLYSEVLSIDRSSTCCVNVIYRMVGRLFTLLAAWDIFVWCSALLTIMPMSIVRMR